MPAAAAIWNNFADTTPGVFNISPVAWNYMYVKMENGLACSRADISPDIVTVGAKLFFEHILYNTGKKAYCPVFFRGSVKIGFHMSFGNYKSMTFTDRAGIEKSQGQIIFCNNFK